MNMLAALVESDCPETFFKKVKGDVAVVVLHKGDTLLSGEDVLAGVCDKVFDDITFNNIIHSYVLLPNSLETVMRLSLGSQKQEEVDNSLKGFMVQLPSHWLFSANFRPLEIGLKSCEEPYVFITVDNYEEQLPMVHAITSYGVESSSSDIGYLLFAVQSRFIRRKEGRKQDSFLDMFA